MIAEPLLMPTAVPWTTLAWRKTSGIQGLGGCAGQTTVVTTWSMLDTLTRSPVGGKKAYSFFLDETAVLFEEISVSAGMRFTLLAFHLR